MRAALALAAFALAAPGTASAQARFRGELGASLELSRRWQVNVSERLLLGDGIASTGRWQTLVGGVFSPTRYLRLGVGYRLSGEEDYGGPRLRHRALAEATGDVHWRSLRFAWRLRFQNTFEDHADGVSFDPFVRNRASVRWRSPSPIDVSVGFEVFSDVKGPVEVFDRHRTELGVTARLRPFELELTYRYDASFDGQASEYHMVMVSLVWQWSRRSQGRGHRPHGGGR